MKNQLPEIVEEELPPLTVNEMWGETMRFFNFEKGIPFTFISLMRYPLETVKIYLRSNRRTFFNPLNYILIAVAIYTAIVSIHAGFNSFMQNANEKNEKVYSKIEKDLDITIYEHYARSQELMMSYQNIFYLIILPVIGFVTHLLFSGKFNYAEHLAINAYVFGTSTWIGVILTLATFYIEDFVVIFVLIPFISAAVLTYLYKKIFESSWLMGIATTLIIYFIIMFLTLVFQLALTLLFMFT